jgi:hypothetical protein
VFAKTKVAVTHKISLLQSMKIKNQDNDPMQRNIASTIFYSLLFAMGGAPTIAMLIIQSQPHDPALMYQIFIGLTVMIACVLVPLILVQNAYLCWKRKDEQLDEKIKPFMQFYLMLNVLCLVYWLIYQFT